MKFPLRKCTMKAQYMLKGRKKKGWTQQEAAARLGVSQSYVALMERGVRSVPKALARKAANLYGLPPTALSVSNCAEAKEESLARWLASLGYPGFSHLAGGLKKNPAEVLFRAINKRDLDSRLAEALPWLLMRYSDLDWEWLCNEVERHHLQNRLGFVTSLARRVAEARQDARTAAILKAQEGILDSCRLAKEDTLCHESMPEAEKRWLKENRPAEALYWNLLTDLSPQHLSYAQ
jgi:transcriptional regulator with XRE-family HTH domain